jgi:hypothetical protein
MRALWDMAPWSLFEVDRHFRGAYRLHRQDYYCHSDEAVRTSETSVYFNETTRKYIPEGSHLRPKTL